jgi:signal transduction histidine kinase/Tfp pilus assembly protein PilF
LTDLFYLFLTIKQRILPRYQNIMSCFVLAYSLGNLLNPSLGLAQDFSRTDSLKKELATAKDTSRFNLLQELFKSYNQTDFNVSLQYAQEAYQLAESLGDSSKIVEGGRMMAYSLMDLGRNDESIDILNKVLGIARRNQVRYPELKPKIKFLLNNAAISYMYRGNYDSSLSYHFKSLEIRENEGDKKSIGTALNNIGLVFFKLENFEQALYYYLRSLDLKNELNDITDVDKILINVGLCYTQLDKSEEAIVSFNKALSRCGSGCSETVKKEIYFGLGSAYFNLGNYDKSTENLQKSLEISKKQNDKQYWIGNLIWLSKIETQKRNYKAGLEYLNEAKQFEKESEFAESLINFYGELAKVYNNLADFENASLYQGKYIKLKDSIISSKLIKNLATIQNAYEQRKNIKTISEKDRILQLQNELIRRQQIQYIFIVIVTILATGLALVLIWSNRRQKIHNAALNDAKRVITDQNERLLKTNEYLDQQVAEKTQDLFMTNESLIQVNSELDNFIYRTSHDIRGPLVTLKGVCNVALLDVRDEVALDYLRKLDATAGKLNVILTRLLIVNKINLWEIEASLINCADLIAMIIETERVNGIPDNMLIEYEIDRDIRLFSDQFLLMLVIENLIDNAVKFYNDSPRVIPFVKIIVHQEGAKIRMIVIDNGIGVNSTDKDHIFHLFTRASDRSETGGIGLYLSKMAANKLGGEVILANTSPSGSEFHLILPMDITPIIEMRMLQELKRKKEKEMREQKLAKDKTA